MESTRKFLYILAWSKREKQTNRKITYVFIRIFLSESFDTKRNFFYIGLYAGVVKLVDARDSKSREPQAHVGSIPTSGTNFLLPHASLVLELPPFGDNFN